MPTSTIRRRRPRLRALVLAAAACAAALSAATPAHAIPFRGHLPLVVVLCKTVRPPGRPGARARAT